MQMPTATDPTLLSKVTNPQTTDRAFGRKRTEDASVSPDQIITKMPVSRPADKVTVPFSFGDKDFMARFDPARLEQIAEFEFKFKFVQSTKGSDDEHRSKKVDDDHKHEREASFKSSFEAMIEKPVERMTTLARKEIRDAVKGQEGLPSDLRREVLSVRQELKIEVSGALEVAKDPSNFDADALQSTLRSAFEGFISALGSIFGQNTPSRPAEAPVAAASSAGSDTVPASSHTAVAASVTGSVAAQSAAAPVADPVQTAQAPAANAAQNATAERADAEAAVARESTAGPSIADLFAGFLESVQNFFEQQFARFAESLTAANDSKTAGLRSDDDHDDDDNGLASPVEASVEAKFEAELSYSARTEAGAAAYSASFSASYSFSATSTLIDTRS